jgi:cytochrome c553
VACFVTLGRGWTSVICVIALVSSLADDTIAARIKGRRDTTEQASALPGAAIYRRGVLPSGQPLRASREGNLQIAGADAACINCHRRSGLGALEGSIKIPPISGRYLFHPRDGRLDSGDLAPVEGMRDRDPYDDGSLARAIREGIGPDGSPLTFLMPRYSLSDIDMAELIAYLKAMTPSKVPGVDGSVVHFATIVTPDADPVKRRAMLDVLNQYFADQNEYALAESGSKSSLAALKSNAKRRWQLHVWELHGLPSEWGKQLAERRAHEPVYAAISGLAGSNWEPVHEFCEESSLPCLFPNVELPLVAEHDFYSLYFSRGVLLEASLLAEALTADKTSKPLRLVQVFRSTDVGAPAAAALHSALNGSNVDTVERAIPGNTEPSQLAALLKKVRPTDALVLWLRPADLAALASVPASSSRVFMSGLMGGLDEAPLPATWRHVTQMTYPVDLPEKRVTRVGYAFGWMALHHIPVLAEHVQVDTYVACSILLEALNHMPGSFAPDYLVERLEGMLERQVISGYYPRLELAPNERFASKGGYLIQFAGPTGVRLVADGGWVVP